MNKVNYYLKINANLFNFKKTRLSVLCATPPPCYLIMKLSSTFTVLYCPVDGCDLEKPFQASDKLLEHLEQKHEVKIYQSSGVEPFLDQYLEKYKVVLEKGSCTLGSENDDEDLKIRQSLHLKMLNGLLESQQMERNTVYKKSRMCLFCSELCPNLPEVFNHMFQVHHFNIGLLDNLIFVETFLNELEEMTKFKKQCIFCNEIFRSGTCLRKHLKSKNHFKINGKHERWDRFYLVNYVNLVKCKTNNNNNNNEEDTFIDEDIDEWQDLNEEIDVKTQCLFCDKILIDPEGCFDHMSIEHGFNMKNIQKTHNLSFYDTMKLVNYLRNCQRNDTNPFEEDSNDVKIKFERDEIPDAKLWNRPEFYFPVYEEDPLLTAIEEFESEELEDSDIVTATENVCTFK